MIDLEKLKASLKDVREELISSVPRERQGELHDLWDRLEGKSIDEINNIELVTKNKYKDAV